MIRCEFDSMEVAIDKLEFHAYHRIVPELGSFNG